MNFYEKVSAIQVSLKAPKSQYNSFANYKYRNIEDIMEGVKPLLNGLVLSLTDDVVLVGDRIYIKSTATITDGENSLSATGFAREAMLKKGMDDAQITGACASYAGKYALGKLLLCDDSKDADSHEPEKKVMTVIEKAISECNSAKQLTDLYKSLTDEDKGLYQELFTTRKGEIV